MGAKFTGKAQRALNRALFFAREMGHTYIGTEHLLLGLLSESDCIASGVLENGGVGFNAAKGLVKRSAGVGDATEVSPSDMTPKTKKIIEDAAKEAAKVKNGYIGTEHLLWAILSEPECFGYKIITSAGGNIHSLRTELAVFIPSESKKTEVRSAAGDASLSPALSKYGVNLVASAAAGELDPVIGREEETERVMQILSRRTKNNPCLIGEAGVGKTAVVEGLAIRIADGNVPSALKDRVIVTLDIPSMIAGAKYRGEFEERMKGVMEEVRKNRRIILFIDEMHTIVGAGAAEGAVDAANIIKPALSRGEMQMIGATTNEEYRRHIEKDAALERRFQPVRIKEPDEAHAYEILKGLRDRYEAHHKLKISDEAMKSAVSLSARYLRDRYLPDKAIDLIDETASRKRIDESIPCNEIKEIEEKLKDAGAEKKEAILTEDYETACAVRDMEKSLITEYRNRKADLASDECSEKEVITGDDVAKTLTLWTGIPVAELEAKDENELSHLEEKLLSSVIGQDDAVRSAARAIKRGRVGIKDPERPVAVLLFAGPSGVGKTELTKALAEAVFHDPKKIIRLDMSEYSEKHSVSKLIGSPPGYVGFDEGGKLTEAVRREPYSIVLFDEVEKAHPDVLNILLQINDEGRLTDSGGRECDFRNAVIVMTSNIGGELITNRTHLGFSASDDTENLEIGGELKKYFSPEFIGRIDETVVFRPLGEESLEKIAEKFLGQTVERLSAGGINAVFDAGVAKALVSMSDSGKYGARPLRNLSVRMIDDMLAEEMIAGRIGFGDRITVKSDGKSFSVEKDGEKVLSAR